MRILLVLVAIAGCGRIGFERAGVAGDRDGGGDAIEAAECAGGCGAGEYCGTPTGICGGPGTCMPQPLDCPATFDPVCGCNDMTYDSACFAQSVGITVRVTGDCPSTYIPPCDPPCSATEYCDLTACQGPGTCTPEPPDTVMCPDVIVCGCDGKVYGNSCAARRAGVDVANQGTCTI